MAAVPIIFLSNASVLMRLITEPGTSNREFDGTCYTAEVLTTPGDETAVVTLDGTRHVRQGRPSYALHLVMGQDWRAQGMSRWLFENAGAQAAFAVKVTDDPLDADHPQIEGTVWLVEPTYGGEADTWAEAEVTLPCVARPSLRTSGTPPLARVEGVDYRETLRTPTPISAVLPDYEPAPAEQPAA